MAIVEMTKRDSATPGFEYAETIATGATGSVVHVFPVPLGKRINCTLVAGANTGYFETTSSSDAKVLAGTAVWSAWAKGTQTGTVKDAILADVTGIRGVSAVGEIKIEIVI